MELSMVATFDELKRCQDILTDGTAEIEFRRFLQMIEESRQQWQATTAEAQRLQRELDKFTKERSEWENKICNARKMLEVESKSRKAVEKQNEQLEMKLMRASEFLRTDRDINDETRNKLAFLNMSQRKRKSRTSRYFDDKYGNEINSTGSFLSDLSITQSEEDFLDTTKPFKKHRPSARLNMSYMDAKQRRRSRKSGDLRSKKNTSIIDLDASEKIIATTKVLIPQDDGPVEATSTIEAVPAPSLYKRFDRIDEPTKPYDRINEKENKETYDSELTTPRRRSMKMQQEYPMPSAPPLQEVSNNPKLLLNLQGRQHEYTSRTVLRSETCANCLKKLRFGSSALKCRLCSCYLHGECKHNYITACIPKSQGTPNFKNGKQGYLSDYVPASSPMIPPLIIHCSNEVETRGLTEEGIYRVSGSDKKIKALKERILRSKALPPLSNVDIHVVCGCIKDFLRGLQEPLIPTSLWKNFANAVGTADEQIAVRELFAAINKLPQANRDSLAYLILHLQRVASCDAIKMPKENLAKIFGPTVLGYSSAEPDQQSIFMETTVQRDVMLHLLEIPTEYWERFVSVNENTDTDSQMVSGYSYFGTPNARTFGNTTIRKERKFFPTPPYTAKR